MSDRDPVVAGGGEHCAGQGVLAGLLGCGRQGEQAAVPSPAERTVSISATRGVPSVRVPVLSKATRSVVPNFSSATADFTSTPCRPAFAIVESSGGIVASTTAHGEATIMKVMARSSVGSKAAPRAAG